MGLCHECTRALLSPEGWQAVLLRSKSLRVQRKLLPRGWASDCRRSLQKVPPAPMPGNIWCLISGLMGNLKASRVDI